MLLHQFCHTSTLLRHTSITSTRAKIYLLLVVARSISAALPPRTSNCINIRSVATCRRPVEESSTNHRQSFTRVTCATRPSRSGSAASRVTGAGPRSLAGRERSPRRPCRTRSKSRPGKYLAPPGRWISFASPDTWRMNESHNNRDGSEPQIFTTCWSE